MKMYTIHINSILWPLQIDARMEVQISHIIKQIPIVRKLFRIFIECHTSCSKLEPLKYKYQFYKEHKIVRVLFESFVHFAKFVSISHAGLNRNEYWHKKVNIEACILINVYCSNVHERFHVILMDGFS